MPVSLSPTPGGSVSFRCLRVISLALAIFAAGPRAVACDPGADPLGPRFSIQFFDYAGATDGEARNQSSRFRAVMSDKVIAWEGELQQLTGAHSELTELQLVSAGPDNLSGVAAISDYWTRTHSLELLRGLLEPSAASTYIVRSRIYFGDLGAALRSDSILVSMKISGAEMANTVDAHTIVTYFALAMDLKRRRCDSAAVIGVISRIHEKFVDLRRRGPLDPVLAPIELAAGRMLEEAKQHSP